MLKSLRSRCLWNTRKSLVFGNAFCSFNSFSRCRLRYPCKTLYHQQSKPLSRLGKVSTKESSNIPAVSDISLEQGVRLSRQACSKSHVEWVEPVGQDTGVKIYNTLTKRKDPLILPQGNTLNWYSCGPTVYDHSHIGHASSYVRQDTVRRILENHFNVNCVMVMGITDIDDKLILQSQKEGRDMELVARHYEQEFFKDMQSLNVKPPTIKTRVTEHVPHIIKFIEQIITNGFAYPTSTGNVYFDVLAYDRYGELQRGQEDPSWGSVNPEKRSKKDFALWKAAKPNEPWWSSPWGNGRPGWHIECSTMASTIFGTHIDLHSGGDDLIFPHHENEIAQSQACFCHKQWSNYWLHTGYLRKENSKDKMSKSLKNTIWITDIMEEYTACQFRLFTMLVPHNNVIDYSDERMMKAVRLHKIFTEFRINANAYIKGQLASGPIDESLLLQKLSSTRERVKQALADNFDTAKVIAELHEMVHITNKQLGSNATVQGIMFSRSPSIVAAISEYLNSMLESLGIFITPQMHPSHYEIEQLLDGVMGSLVDFRGKVRHYAAKPPEIALEKSSSAKELKKSKSEIVGPLYEACDELRSNLSLYGISIKDYRDGASWEKSSEKQK